MKLKITLVLLITLLLQCKTRVIEEKVEAEITTWYENKPGAISISFDDASYGQYVYAMPTMEKYGIIGTFSLVGAWTKDVPTYSAEPGIFEIKKMSWSNIREIQKKGHEIAAHGYTHTRYDDSKPKHELVAEIKKMKDLIELNINSPAYTLQYPYSHTSKKIFQATKEAGFILGRTANDSLNPISPPNIYKLASQPIINNSSPTDEEFKGWISETENKWLIIMYHHIFTDNSKEMKILRHHKVKYTYAILPKNFDKQMKIVSENKYWKAPISSVGKYIKERNQTKVSAVRYKNKIFITTSNNLDKNIYNHPITIKIKVPWKRVKVKGTQKDGVIKSENNYIFVNIIPESQVIISKHSSN